MRGAVATALALFSAAGLPAQTSRTDEILAEREQKASDLTPEAPSTWERRLDRFKDGRFLEKFSDGIGGIRLKVGSLASGGGFAIGPQYSRDDLLGGQLSFSASAQHSMRGFQKQDLYLG